MLEQQPPGVVALGVAAALLTLALLGCCVCRGVRALCSSLCACCCGRSADQAVDAHEQRALMQPALGRQAPYAQPHAYSPYASGQQGYSPYDPGYDQAAYYGGQQPMVGYGGWQQVAMHDY